jgi:hypothetical protein
MTIQQWHTEWGEVVWGGGLNPPEIPKL